MLSLSDAEKEREHVDFPPSLCKMCVEARSHEHRSLSCATFDCELRRKIPCWKALLAVGNPMGSETIAEKKVRN